MAYTTIDDPSAYFHTQLYTGTGSELSVTNGANAGDFKPDWIWIKQRNAGSTDHGMFDSSRGVTKNLKTNGNDAESTEAQSVKTFNTDGFTLGTSGDYNGSSDTHVAWQWKANGGTATTNDASSTGVGSIDSVYQANTTAGFSIVTYTGTGSTATVAHGLGAVPDMLIFKKRSAADNWYVYHKSLTNDYYIVLDTTGAKNNDVNIFNDTNPTSTVFSIANAGVHADGKTMVCYAFKNIQGYSKFGSYTGNGSTNGPVIYTGFKPSWLMYKRIDASGGDWVMIDNKTDPVNPCDEELYANLNAGTGDVDLLDFLSNGFKCRRTHPSQNASGETYIYMAFAEHPFVSSKGVPTTAR